MKNQSINLLSILDYKAYIDKALIDLNNKEIDNVTARSNVMLVNGALNIAKTSAIILKASGSKITINNINNLLPGIKENSSSKKLIEVSKGKSKKEIKRWK